MPEITNPSKTPPKHEPPAVDELSKEKKIDRVADDAAKQAEKTEHRYDGDHDIFTK